ncbi:MAG TPA: glycogen/starch synthase [Candidatus Treponema faecavium]|nr:glycogen/starch synthase [Candidatus Treponema faecavium]
MQSIWLISREYAGIAEAGGVKNVSCSLCEGLVRRGTRTMLFIPLYACTVLDAVDSFTELTDYCRIHIAGHDHHVGWARGVMNGVDIVFIISSLFSSRMGVYTYTKEEELRDPSCRRGEGHRETLEMNVLFERAVLEYGVRFPDTVPHMIHCQDAAAALVPVLARRCREYAAVFADTQFVVTIHNAGPGYHHAFDNTETACRLTGLSSDCIAGGINAQSGAVEPFLLCAPYACLTTVSPWYAYEIRNPANQDTGGLSQEFSRRGVRVIGITNGIDIDRYDPEYPEKSLLTYPFSPENKDLDGKYRCRADFIERHRECIQAYDGVEQNGFILEPEPDTVWFSYHGRLVRQKGLFVLASAIEELLPRHPEFRFVINGQGEAVLEERYQYLASRFPGRCLYFRGYHRSLARLCTAVADFLVLPSDFEPCGLEDFIAQLFGSIPIAHATGGLNKIIHGETGYLYHPNTEQKLAAVLAECARRFIGDREFNLEIIAQAAMFVRYTYSWDEVISRKYIPLYRWLYGRTAGQTAEPAESLKANLL